MRTMKKAIWHDQTCDLMNNIVWATEGVPHHRFFLTQIVYATGVMVRLFADMARAVRTG